MRSILLLMMVALVQACSTAAAGHPTVFSCTQVAFMATGDASTEAFNFGITYRCTNGESTCLVNAAGAMSCIAGGTP